VVGTVGLNYESEKLGRKDMIKLAVEELPAPVLQHIAMIRSGVTVKRIQNFLVEKKFVVGAPDTLEGQARCRNPNCVTNHERDTVTKFRRTDSEGKRFQCTFCERIFPLTELEFIIPAQ